MKTRLVVGIGVLTVLLTWICLSFLGYAVMRLRVPAEMPTETRLVNQFPLVVGSVLVDEVVYARGTWKSDGLEDKNRFEPQTTMIRCRRHQRICSTATAWVLGNGIVAPTLGVDVQTYEVAEWTDDRIVFSDGRTGCFARTYMIDVATGSVMSRRTPGGRTDCAPQDEPPPASLVDGRPLSEKAKSEAMPWFGRLGALPLRMVERYEF